MGRWATITKSYKLRLYISPKFITANVLDKTNGDLVAQASTIEHGVKRGFDFGRLTTPEAGTVVAQVLARRMKFETLFKHPELTRGIHVDVNKEVEKKGVHDEIELNSKIVWAILNSLKGNGVNVMVDEGCKYSDPSL